jgi:hypothetical protein
VLVGIGLVEGWGLCRGLVFWDQSPAVLARAVLSLRGFCLRCCVGLALICPGCSWATRTKKGQETVGMGTSNAAY